MARAAAAVGAALALAAVSGAPTAHADVGARVSPGDMSVTQTLRVGSTYHFPDIVVSNPATEAGDYTMLAGSVQGQSELTVEPAWFGFSPASFTLGPGDERSVSVSLMVPTEAKPGDYAALLKAQVTPAGASGVAVGAAAATKVRFTVERPEGIGAVVAAVRDAIGGLGPWPVVILLLIAVLLIARLAWRRWDIRIERRR